MSTSHTYGQQADLALGLWVKLARAFATFSKRSLEDIRRYNLTQPQFGALETLGHLGPMPIGMLCRKQLVSGGNMTLVVDNLEQEGLVERVPSQDDHRKVVVQLTAKGRGVFKRTFARHAECITRLASVLTTEEQKTLSQLLKKLGTGIQDRSQQQ